MQDPDVSLSSPVISCLRTRLRSKFPNIRFSKSKLRLFLETIEKRTDLPKSPLHNSEFDPFNTLPIANSACVEQTVLYYIQDWSPKFGPAFAFEDHPNPFLSLLWPFALQSDIYFESIIALSRAALLADRGESANADKAFIRHRGNAITKLQARLRSPDQCIQDSTILAASVLGTIEYILGDHAAAAAHTMGLKHMIKLRGGMSQNTPLERQLRAVVFVYESLWSSLPASVPTTEQSEQSPIYLKHPFTPEVCQILSNIPPGFCDVALTGVLSLQTIRLLSDLTATTAQLNGPKYLTIDASLEHRIQTTLEILHSPLIWRVTETERNLCHGLVVYCYLLRLIHFHEVVTGYCGLVLQSFAESALRRTPTLTAFGPKCHVWTLMMVVELLKYAQRPTAQWIPLLQQAVVRWPEFRQWDELEGYLKTFFWDESMGTLSRLAYDEAAVTQEAFHEVHP
ncbi:hypothetical protein EDD37DRAFT_361768 [Exophiala viscosa]|uniref:uncharacterized protein n=1 Tax=Exophiala viscosa TaxID=2486360 RepID=UPI0021931B50|nr:hypothetical protein EDD37DRAFT_361768 [Exophiala viscosa]